MSKDKVFDTNTQFTIIELKLEQVERIATNKSINVIRTPSEAIRHTHNRTQ